MPQVYIPMPAEEKRKLIKDIKEDMKPLINKISHQITDKALEPIKRNIRQVESDMILENKKILANVES